MINKTGDYIAENSPAPLPTHVKVNIQILDIIDVDEDAQLLTLHLKFLLNWNDLLLNVNRSEIDIDK